jgi:hypothetical protein
MLDQTHSTAMNAFQFVSVSTETGALSLGWIECAGDVDAAMVAETLMKEGLDIEVWDVGRLVTTRRKPKAGS